MTLTKSSLSKRNQISHGNITSYSVAAAAFLLSGLSAESQIIYTDVDPDETFSADGDQYLLDLNNDGDVDFKIGIGDFLNPDMFHIGAVYYTGLVRYIRMYPYNGEIAGSHPGSYDYPYVIDAGEFIGGGLVFQNNPAETFFYHLSVKDFPVVGFYYSYAGGDRGNWDGNTDKYVGLKLVIGAESYYGWARLDCGADHHSFTIKDYAYEATPFNPIAAGYVPVDVSFTDDATSVGESGGTTSVSLQLSESANCSVNVSFNAPASTATNGVDFSFTDPSPVIFTAGGVTTQSFNINITNDVFDEPDETVVFDIESVSGACQIVDPDNIIITITDNDLPPQISFASPATTVFENVTPVTGTANISVTSDCTVNVNLNTSLSTAIEGTDFTFTSPATLSFTAGGPTSLDFIANIIEDGTDESDETIVFDLATVAGACTLTEPDQYTITIANDDAAALISFTDTELNYSETDGIVSGSVSISETADCIFNIILDEAGSTATSGLDYTFAGTAEIDFTAGDPLSLDFDIELIDDVIVEPDETIHFTLETAVGNCLLDADNDELTMNVSSDDLVSVQNSIDEHAIIYSFDNSVFLELLNNDWKDAEVFLFNIEGQKVFNQKINQPENIYKFESLPDGIYLIQLLIDGKVFQKNVYLGKK